MEVFGFLIPIFPELLTIVLGLVIVYLVILELEFRQVRAISSRFSAEETTLEKEIKELRAEIDEFKTHLAVMADALHYKKPLPDEKASLAAAKKATSAPRPAAAPKPAEKPAKAAPSKPVQSNPAPKAAAKPGAPKPAK